MVRSEPQKFVLCVSHRASTISNMIYSDHDLKRLLTDGTIRVDPPPNLDVQLGSCSLDLRLSNEFSLFEYNKYPFIDIRDAEQARHTTREIRVENEQAFVLHPGSFVLAVTIERIELPDHIVARLEGRSS